MARKRRGRQLERVLRLIRAFTYAQNGYTLPELMSEFAASRRTVYRDLETLERAGFRFEREGSGEGRRRWRFTAGQRKQLGMTFTEDELASLYFCINFLSPLRGTPLREGLERALSKIESTFNARDRERFEDLIFTHLARPGPHKDYARHGRTLAAVSRACLERRKLVLTYRATADDTPKTYRFHPYCLAYAGGDLYSIGFSELRRGIRTLRIDRIQDLSVTPEPFERPKDFDAEEYLVRGFGMYAEGPVESVRIEFRDKAAQTIRDKEWHPTQRLEERSNGRVILKMQVQGLWEVARWVLSHAPNARVLEPPALRRLVSDLAHDMAQSHQKS
ncbi:MAG: WYL domain-containing transcriptional regulator [Planctomycetes bacterium]|nr:WYL domain-containing transcriptional regulator [Planctomycetota bacterium]